MLRLLLAATHLLALGIGLGSIWARAQALHGAAREGSARGALASERLRVVFVADSWWGVAAAIWLVTGLWRALTGTEKAPSYYAHNVVFWAKMGLFVTVVLLELWPMITLIRWRKVLARGAELVGDPRTATRMARISQIEAALIVLIVLAAVSMARGYGARG